MRAATVSRQPLGVRKHLELDAAVRAREGHALHAHAAAAAVAGALPLLLRPLLGGVGSRRLGPRRLLLSGVRDGGRRAEHTGEDSEGEERRETWVSHRSSCRTPAERGGP
jgi:hypothetical protein